MLSRNILNYVTHPLGSVVGSWNPTS